MALPSWLDNFRTFTIKASNELFVPPKKQIPALDGVRAIAILLVVGLHSNIQVMRSGLEKASFAHFPPFQGGWIGVPLFFILSGFFIGTQLWREFLKTDTVDVKRFILRRGLRIWPLYYFIFVVVLLIFPERCQDLWTNLLFVANYFGDRGPIRGAWSLSTEEQFYFVIPTLIFVLARFCKFKTLGQYRNVLWVLLFLPIFTRGVTWYMHTGFEFFDINLYINKIYRPFHTHFDGLIVGLLISNAMSDKTFRTPTLLKKYGLFVVLATIVGVGLKLSQKVLFTYWALAIIFGSVVWMSLHTENWVTRILSWRPFYGLAKVSFGVYLVHHPVLWALESLGWFERVLWHPDIYLLLTYGITLLISSCICSVTYVFVEAPFIQWRNQLLSKK